jgi:integrase
MKFTDKGINALKPKEKKYYIHGDMSNNRHGFAICVYPASQKYPSGTKSWFFIYNFAGKRCFIPLGKYPTVGLADASREFEKQWSIFASGKNPATVKEDQQAALDAAPTVKVLGDDYIKRHAEVNKKSWLEDKRILEKEIYPIWGNRKAADITKKDVIRVLDNIVARPAPGTANNTFKIIRKMFNWAIKKDILEASPCDRIDMPAPLVSKDRQLNAAEIKALWKSLESKTTSMTVEVRQALKLILITAQRPAEVTGIHTNEINGNWWNLPAERTKNGKAHRIYLSGLAQDIIAKAIQQVKLIRELPADQVYSGYIFPCPHRSKNKPIERHALSRALKRNESDDKQTTLGVATFTPHDLRRTAATMMSELGFMDEIIDAVLNHTKKGVIATYNRNKYDAEKQDALEVWAKKLNEIICSTDVIQKTEE